MTNDPNDYSEFALHWDEEQQALYMQPPAVSPSERTTDGKESQAEQADRAALQSLLNYIVQGNG